MNVLLWIARRQLPAFVRKREFMKLFRLTATAFDSEIPSLRGLTYDECLHTYARFTRAAVDRAVEHGQDLERIQVRLFEHALAYGQQWRRRFGISRFDDTMKAGWILYRAIGIDFCGSSEGTIEISRCLFSKYYSPATCSVVSSIDAGILAGLSGGRVLSFGRRITEGFSSCIAQLLPPEKSS
jgi:hypothetical protein